MSSSTTIAYGEAAVAITASAATDVGLVRSGNEDAHLLQAPVFLVADGMRGHRAGELASAAARDAFARAVRAGTVTTPAVVLDAISAANAAARRLGGGTPATMSGSTLAGVALVASDAGLHWMVVNIGDSRVYRFDGRRLSQVSVDHSLVQELLDAGLISVDDARHHPDRNVVTRALGAADDVDSDVWLLPVEARQTFVLCSDGVSKELDDDEIERLLVCFDPHAGGTVAEAIVRAAVAAGGSDNVTAVVVEARLTGAREADDGDTIDRERLESTRPRF